MFIFVVGLVSAFLIASNSMIYIASLSLFADLFYYVIGIAASFFLRKKHPELKRPFKAPGIMIGAPVSIAIYVLMMTQLDREALITGVIWCILGLIIYGVCRTKYKNDVTEDLSKVIMEEEIPTPEEKQKMDREFKIWTIVVACAVVIALVAYVVPFIVG